MFTLISFNLNAGCILLHGQWTFTKCVYFGLKTALSISNYFFKWWRIVLKHWSFQKSLKGNKNSKIYTEISLNYSTHLSLENNLDTIQRRWLKRHHKSFNTYSTELYQRLTRQCSQFWVLFNNIENYSLSNPNIFKNPYKMLGTKIFFFWSTFYRYVFPSRKKKRKKENWYKASFFFFKS